MVFGGVRGRVPLALSLPLSLLGCPRAPDPGEAPVAATEPAEPPARVDPSPKAPSPAVTPPSTPTDPAAPAATCLARWAFDNDRSVLAEQRQRGGAARWDDFPTRYPAAYLDPDADHPVELVARFEVGATPLLWFTADFSEAVVNAAVLSELAIVDATGLAVDQQATIGRLTELGLGHLRGAAWASTGLGGRELAEFLLAAGVVQTWVHIGSELCLLAEHDDEHGYRARFTGEHEYYTNEANLDPLGFELVVTAAGSITIVGVAPIAMPAAVARP